MVKTEVPFEDVVFIAEHNRNFPGIYWKSMPIRVYPHRDMLSHVVGYVGIVSERELMNLSQKGYNLRERGRQERRRADVRHPARGKDGYVRRIVDATNQVSAELVDRGAEPTPGNNVLLSIDAGVQRIAEQALGETPGAVSCPNPRPGRFSLWLRIRDTTRICSSPRRTGDLQETHPRSEEAVPQQGDPGAVPGGVHFQARRGRSAPRHGQGAAVEGVQLRRGIPAGQPFFFLLVESRKSRSPRGDRELVRLLFLPGLPRAGPEVISQYARKLGLGKKLDVDLIGELDGFVPDPAWKRENKGRAVVRGRHAEPRDRSGVPSRDAACSSTPSRTSSPTGALLYKPYVVSRDPLREERRGFLQQEAGAPVRQRDRQRSFRVRARGHARRRHQGHREVGGGRSLDGGGGEDEQRGDILPGNALVVHGLRAVQCGRPSRDGVGDDDRRIRRRGERERRPYYVGSHRGGASRNRDLETARRNIWKKRAEVAQKRGSRLGGMTFHRSEEVIASIQTAGFRYG